MSSTIIWIRNLLTSLGVGVKKINRVIKVPFNCGVLIKIRRLYIIRMRDTHNDDNVSTYSVVWKGNSLGVYGSTETLWTE